MVFRSGHSAEQALATVIAPWIPAGGEHWYVP